MSQDDPQAPGRGPGGHDGGRGRPRRSWRGRHLQRLGASAAAGVLAGLATAPLPLGGWPAHVMLGVAVALLVSAGWVLRLAFTLDSRQTAEHFAGVDGTRREVELLSLGAAAVAVVGMGLLMTTAQGDPWAAVVGLLAVAAAWLTVHTTFTLSYAKHWLTSEPGCIDFPTDAAPPDERLPDDDAGRAAQRRTPPPLSDFLYTALSVGMTYQISDTTLKSTAMRLLVTKHALLSFVFGTVVVASTINLVVSLATGAG